MADTSAESNKDRFGTVRPSLFTMDRNFSFSGFKNQITAVTGATGLIGRQLIDRLLKINIPLRLLTRDAGRIPEQWRKKAEIIEGDLFTGRERFCRGAGVVFHLAGEIREKKNFVSTNVQGTAALLEECRRAHIEKLVYLSSVGVIGASGSRSYDETSACLPANAYEKSKHEAECLVREYAASGAFKTAVLRPSIVYGPGRVPEQDSFLALVRAIDKGYFHFIGRGEGIYNIVYAGDVAEALLRLAAVEDERCPEGVIINQPLTWKEFVSLLSSELGVEHSFSSLPVPIALALAFVCEAGRRIGLKMPFSLSRYRALTCKTVFSSRLLCSDLGFTFISGHKQGIKNTLAYYRQQGLI